ncbi:Cupin-like domain-containing protein [Rozella allomycis CSF55]|uniref:Cupin-like domain-containing protein n=1 Tax=Rozella allomycis (strain CSF55) TaxID=988480 RepID=A0A075AYL0_ROZAC|nr:Cupin-like domain-containing protein [Rozella allomycis CSF55]|eukprot:EPZ33604.1 Cupin-like domain-containing protein [Rozella allomycis CSF55]
MDIQEAQSRLATETSLKYVEEVDADKIDSLTFLRYVSKNQPFIVKNGIKEWDAYKKWEVDYLSARLSDSEITIAVTPLGNADSAVGEYFVLPEEKKMSFGHFILNLEKNNDQIHYLQSQNDNLSQDVFAAIRKDVPESIEFASEALDAKPDAVNLWIGNEKSTTSMHKDHYENLYAVVRECKIFTLYPPNYYPFLQGRGYFPKRKKRY